MFAEPSRPGQMRKRQFRALRRYLVDEIHPYMEVHRRALDAAGVDHGRIAGLDEFARVSPTTLDEVGSGAGHLLEPTQDLIRSQGPVGLRLRCHAARLTGGRAKLDHERLAPRYKPLLWTRDGILRTGWSAADLRRLGDLGRRLLQRAGVVGADRLLTVGLAPDQTAFWQLSLGARAGGVTAMHLTSPDPAVLVDGNASVIAGPVAAIDAMFAAVEGHAVTTAIVVGEPPSAAERARLCSRWSAEVVSAWAPPGVRSLWSERRGVPGLVTSADADVVEIVDGEVVWSSLGWAGTVLLRLRTGVHATGHATSSGTGGVTVTLRDPAVVTS
ncbi:MAG TPA: hypothetical protein VMW08_02740 [Acidimicrobiales bacterium]|nr:hypothetical protein [Acidimicrobiales bacterium]